MAEKYLAKKDVLLQYLEDASAAIKEADSNGDASTIKNKFASVEVTFPDLLKQFDELNLQVYKKKNDVPDQTVDYVRTLDVYGEMKTIHSKYINTPDRSADNQPVPAKVKLPPIEIPTFTGDPTTWKLFKESFIGLIHNNHKLSPIQKVQYLTSKLQGKAASICSGVDCTGDNYELLWKSLVTRYDDPRSLATFYFNKLMTFQTRKLETPNKLTEFLDEFCSVVESLRSLKLDNLEDFIILNLALNKLPPETIKSFETAMLPKGKNIPQFHDLKNL